MDKVGPGNPPKHTQFKKGQSGNPGGISSETARLIRENAEAAARIRNKMLQATEDKLGQADSDAMALIEAAMLKLLKDVEDRGMGTAKQSLDLTSDDGSMTPRATSDAVLDALKAKHGPKPE